MRTSAPRKSQRKFFHPQRKSHGPYTIPSQKSQFVDPTQNFDLNRHLTQGCQKSTTAPGSRHFSLGGGGINLLGFINCKLEILIEVWIFLSLESVRQCTELINSLSN